MSVAHKIGKHVDETALPKISQKEFGALADILYAKARIFLEPSKISLVSSRLGRRLRALQLGTWSEYIALLAQPGSPELQEFINSLTTNKTEFFREEKHFDYLTSTYLPKIAAGSNRLMVWVAASSYGQEAYSMAMAIEEYNAKSRPIDYRILATDIDTSALASADRGIYRSEDVDDQIASSLVKKYFLRGVSENSGSYRVSRELHDRVKFRQHNLCAFEQKIPLRFDVIFVRNVLIYFDRPTVEKVIAKCLDHLKPGGILVLGHCESILEMKWNLETVAPSVYLKRPS